MQCRKGTKSRTLISIPGIIVITFILGSAALLIGWMGRTIPFHIERLWARTVLWVSSVTIIIQGQENIFKNSSQMFVANHRGLFDVPALFLALPVKVRFIAKKELFRIPIFGWAMSLSGHISIDRESPIGGIRAFNTAVVQARKENVSICVFPEGSVSWDGALQSLKNGAFVLAARSMVPVVPVWISGSREVLPRGTIMIRPGTIKVSIGEPIDTSRYSRENSDELVDKVAKIMVQLSAQGGTRDA